MRENNKKLKVLVLGGNGFIGRQVVKQLANKAEVIIGTRKQAREENMVSIKMQSMISQAMWIEALQGYDVVVNSVGILRERRNESYEQVHTIAVEALAEACASLAISLVHVSALGLSLNAKSRFIQSKLAGEQAILRSDASATIVRPSLLDGEGGFGAKWFRRVAAWPIHFVMRSDGLVAPLQVSDLGEAIATLVMMPAAQRPEIAELGGDVYNIPQYLMALRKVKTTSNAWQLAVPKLIVRVFSHIFDVLAWTPLSFGHYELMQGYNVPSKNLLPLLLGRSPRPLGEKAYVEQPSNVCV